MAYNIKCCYEQELEKQFISLFRQTVFMGGSYAFEWHRQFQSTFSHFFFLLLYDSRNYLSSYCMLYVQQSSWEIVGSQ